MSECCDFFSDVFVFGCGNMGSAVARTWAGQFREEGFHFYTPSYHRAKLLQESLGGKAYDKIGEMISLIGQENRQSLVLLGCKPQQIESLCQELNTFLTSKQRNNCVFVSILAGTSLTYLSELLNSNQVVRVMPNTPIGVGFGVNLLVFSNELAHQLDNQRNLIHSRLVDLFSLQAKCFTLDTERQLDILTIISGSGPGYLFEMARILNEFLTDEGIDLNLAKEVIAQTFLGSSNLMVGSSKKHSFTELRDQVTSRAGVTEAILTQLNRDAFDDSLKKALKEGLRRVEELSKNKS